ncbi:hypothetical protein CASFOL_012934 [Castilleja foliolosa]|uniref:Glycosyltransferase n=1 Tax=Castilleja foliolosa TaxID=1961234 RepID=A0ABD3DJT0_9LAMI
MNMVDKEIKPYRAHILVVPYPSQGHVNPMLQFCKRLASKDVKPTLTLTNFISKSLNPKSDVIAFDTFSDGFDEGGFNQSDGAEDYLARLEIEGSKSLDQLIKSYQNSSNPIDCIVYDSFLFWALDLAKKYGIKGASFFTQACMVNYVYYYIHHGVLTLPVSTPPAVELPGLPPLELSDMPSFIYVPGSYPAYFKMIVKQFVNLEKADFVLVNTFYKLEMDAVNSMSKVCPILTIGPTIPSFYLDNRVENDNSYDISLFQSDPPTTIINWLNTKPQGSVVYIAFGSMANLSKAQMEEIAWALSNTNFYFLWVLRASNVDEDLPKEFVHASRDKSLFVHWSPQLDVLSNKAVGCFFSHGGWNSTTEALSLGVPMVVFPQWTDQTMDAKLVEDVWRFGVRVRVGSDGIVRREEIESCIREVMEGEKGKEMKRNACKWKDLAKEAVSEGGTSDINIETFISKLTS